MVEVVEPVTTIRLDTPAGLVVAEVAVERRRGAASVTHPATCRRSRSRWTASSRCPGFGEVPLRPGLRRQLLRHRRPRRRSGCRSTGPRKQRHPRRRAADHGRHQRAGPRRSTPSNPEIAGCHHVYLAAPGSDAAALPARDGDPPRLVRPLAVRHRHQRPDGPAARPRRAAAATPTSSTSRSSAPASSAGWSRRPRSAACPRSCPTDHRPRLDHRHRAVPARPRRPVPRRVSCCEAPTMNIIRSHSPQHPDDLVVEVPEATPAEVATAATRARHAQPAWAAAPAATRCAGPRIDRRRRRGRRRGADRARRCARSASRWPRRPARWRRAVAILRYYAQQVYDPIGAVHDCPAAGPLAHHRRRPLASPGSITPWNFPLAIPIWKAAPALAFGNAVLLKPAPQATGVRAAAARPARRDAARRAVRGPARRRRRRAAVIDDGRRRVVHRLAAVGRARRACGRRPRAFPSSARWAGRTRRSCCPTPTSSTRRRTSPRRDGLRRAEVHRDQAGDRRRRRGAPSSPTRSSPRSRRWCVGDPADMATTVGPVIETARPATVTGAADGARPAAAGCSPAGPHGRRRLVRRADRGRRAPRRARLLTRGGLRADRRAARRDRRAEAVALANDVPHGLVAGVYTRDLAGALRGTGPARRRPDQGQRPDHRGRLLPAVRRREGVQLRRARAGQGRDGLLHLAPHRHRRAEGRTRERRRHRAGPAVARPATEHAEPGDPCLRAALVSGQMRPGEVYSAPTLAAQFGVSATPGARGDARARQGGSGRDRPQQGLPRRELSDR